MTEGLSFADSDLIADVKDVRFAPESTGFMDGLSVMFAFQDRIGALGPASFPGQECFVWSKFEGDWVGLFAIFHEHGVDPSQVLRDRMSRVIEHA
jgi:hypothetical protein